MNAHIKGGLRNMRTLMAVAPFAAISSSSVHTLMLITRAVSSFIKLYLLLLFMRVLLSWFPAFNWEDQPWLALRQVCLSFAFRVFDGNRALLKRPATKCEIGLPAAVPLRSFDVPC